mmetsp:Transcript_58347/g.183143  ORF Transcript_58347/g.183143 Transcript_58347/m.183143 type:complete len:223 (+) Transcript_58347:431-1099(+)
MWSTALGAARVRPPASASATTALMSAGARADPSTSGACVTNTANPAAPPTVPPAASPAPSVAEEKRKPQRSACARCFSSHRSSSAVTGTRTPRPDCTGTASTSGLVGPGPSTRRWSCSSPTRSAAACWSTRTRSSVPRRATMNLASTCATASRRRRSPRPSCAAGAQRRSRPRTRSSVNLAATRSEASVRRGEVVLRLAVESPFLHLAWVWPAPSAVSSASD